MVSNILLFHGENEYELEQAIRKVQQDSGCQLREVEDNVDFGDLINLLNTPSLFGGSNLYVARNDSIMSDSGNLKRLEAYLEDPSPFSRAVIALKKKPDGRLNTYKAFKERKLEKEFPLVKGRSLQKWVKEYLWEHGYNIDEAGVAYLVEVVGESQNMLRSEMDKLFLFQPEGRQIRVADLEQIVTSNAEYNIFNLLDNMFGDRGRMLAALENLYRLREPVARILFMIIREFRILLRIKWLLRERWSEEKIATHLKLHPYVAKKKAVLSRKMSYEELFRHLKLFYEAEARIKSNSGDEKMILRSTLLSL